LRKAERVSQQFLTTRLRTSLRLCEMARQNFSGSLYRGFV
jgi:hypothetical protein